MLTPGGGWVPEALAVADHLDIDRFVTVGTSTGAAFALAVAALASERVLGVVPRCSMTDMRWQPARATMSRPTPTPCGMPLDRESAMATAVESHGLDGSKIIESAEGPPLAPSDLAMIAGHPWARSRSVALCD
jgi:pimeloyl-ACP methyl ester carboxylesterase